MASRVLRSGVAGALAWACLQACHAIPIPVDDEAAQANAGHSESTRAAAAELPGASASLSAAARGGAAAERRSTAADPDDKMFPGERGDPLAAARDPALLPIDVQGVGARAHPAPSALPRRPGDDAGGDNDGLRKFAASARDWMHDVFGRPDNAPDNASGDAVPGGPGAGRDLGLPVETQSTGVRAMAQPTQRPVELPAPGAAVHHAAAAAPAQESAGARLLADSAPEYSIQLALKRCREVLVHPLTWLTVLLIGITRIATSRFRR